MPSRKIVSRHWPGVALLCALLAGCAVPGTRDAQEPLRLEVPPAPHERPQRTEVLGVETPRIGAGISDVALIYIEHDFQRRPYVKSRWGAPLSRQLGDLVSDQIAQSGLAGAVLAGRESDLRLEIEVLEWLHDYRTSPPQARIALRTTLRDAQRVVDQWRWSDQRPFQPEGAEPGLAAQQALFEAWLDALLERLDGRLAELP